MTRGSRSLSDRSTMQSTYKVTLGNLDQVGGPAGEATYYIERRGPVRMGQRRGPGAPPGCGGGETAAAVACAYVRDRLDL